MVHEIADDSEVSVMIDNPLDVFVRLLDRRMFCPERDSRVGEDLFTKSLESRQKGEDPVLLPMFDAVPFPRPRANVGQSVFVGSQSVPFEYMG